MTIKPDFKASNSVPVDRGASLDEALGRVAAQMNRAQNCFIFSAYRIGAEKPARCLKAGAAEGRKMTYALTARYRGAAEGRVVLAHFIQDYEGYDGQAAPVREIAVYEAATFLPVPPLQVAYEDGGRDQAIAALEPMLCAYLDDAARNKRTHYFEPGEMAAAARRIAGPEKTPDEPKWAEISSAPDRRMRQALCRIFG